MNAPQRHGMGRSQNSHHLRLGNFGKLFPCLSTWAQDFGIEGEQHQQEVINIMTAIGGPGGIMHDISGSSGDSQIPAAYTFFAQFVDHDITLDAESQLNSSPLDTAGIRSLPNLRSASLDLDSVYGFGPDVSPYLYRTEGTDTGFLATGSDVDGVENPNDVPRTAQGVALIGDFRNDENIFLSQMHLLFLRFHNRLRSTQNFDDAQREVQYHYQYIVLYDLLRRVCDPCVYNFALERICQNASSQSGTDPSYPSRFESLVDESERVIMPVEFSGAAYRFGHTMVRSVYPVNRDYPSVEIFDERLRTTGFRQLSPDLTVDWRFLLDLEEYHPCVFSRRLDPLLANELINLPVPVVEQGSPRTEHSLAFRNLLRGYVFGLPSGQTLATQLRTVGYGELINENPDLQLEELIRDLDVETQYCDQLIEHTPLFLYLMREAEILRGGNHLGPVGSAILMEVFGAMFVHQATFLSEDNWTPDKSVTQGSNELTLADLVRFALS